MNLIQTNFTGGEWSELLNGRVDLAKYRNAVHRMENMVVYPHGPATMRPGLKFIAESKYSNKSAKLLPFIPSEQISYVVEMGDYYARFYCNGALLKDIHGNPVEITTPYPSSAVSGLKYCQSVDCMYLFHPQYPVHRLNRITNASFSILPVIFNPPPTKESGHVPNSSITLSATSGTITITAGVSDTFLTGDIGRIIKAGTGRASIVHLNSSSSVSATTIDVFDTNTYSAGSWQLQGSPISGLASSLKQPVGSSCTLTSQDAGETRVEINAYGLGIFWSDTSPYYLLSSSPPYTATKPTNIYIGDQLILEGAYGSLGINQWAWGGTSEIGYDTIWLRLPGDISPDNHQTPIYRGAGVGNKQIFRSVDLGKYIYINNGIVKLTSITSYQQAIGEIVKELNSINASSVWRMESELWNNTDGYPSCGAFYEDRLICAGAPGNPENIRASRTSSYEDFSTGANDDDGLDLTLSGREVNTIFWLEPREYLICGTHSGEWKVGPDDTGKPLTPTNRNAKLQTTFGCANIMPQTIESSTLFSQRAQRKIREFTWQYEKDGYVAPDVTLLAGHITQSGIKAMAYQQEPLSILYCVLNNGILIGMTYMREQDVIAWHRHPTRGNVEDVVSIPGADQDELWLIIQRTINGTQCRYIEKMALLFADNSETYIANKGLNAFFVDCGITYTGVPTTTITGLDYLEGETVFILADGTNHPPQTVSDGKVTLLYPATVVHVGLPYRAFLQTMYPELDTREGTIQGRYKRVTDAVIRVNTSGPFKAGRDETHLANVMFRTSDMPMDTTLTLFTGDTTSQLEGSIELPGSIVIVQDKPMPLTVTAIIKKIGVY